MIDAPKNYNIVRGKVLEKQADTAEQKKALPKYYPEPKDEIKKHIRHY